MTVDTKLKRLPERGSTDRELANSILDEGVICHVGFTLHDHPYVVPMAYGRDGDTLLLHGSIVSRLMKSLAYGLPCCVTVTHLDAMVLARSTFHHSMNYRSIMVFGNAKPIEGKTARLKALDVLVEHLIPGRSSDARGPDRKELNATEILAMDIDTFTIKSRTGPPGDVAKDMDLDVWAGLIPMHIATGALEPSPDLKDGVPIPDYLK